MASLLLTLLFPASGLISASSNTLSPEAQALIQQLDAKDVYDRQKAFLRLEALREPATADVIRQYLDSNDPHTRAFSARALAAVQGAKAVPVLLERLKKDRHPDVRLAALLALEPLQEHDPTLTPAFIDALRDRKPLVRMAAVDVVSRIDRPEARQALFMRWKRERDRDVRRVLEEAKKRLGGFGAPHAGHRG